MSVAADARANAVATTLYQSWLGASLLAKITHDRAPLDRAMVDTRQLLGLEGRNFGKVVVKVAE